MKWKRLLISMMIGILGTSAPVSAEEIQGHPVVLSEEDSEKTDFPCWNENAPSLAALKEYVEDVTDDNSPNYIPEEDRIAVFDMDGTLYGELAPTYIEWCMYAYRVNEDSSFLPDQDEKDVAEQIVEVMKTGVIPEDLERDHSIQNARVYAGMTVDGYRQYVREFCKRPVVGFDKMTFKDAFYKPMIEVVNYLDENGFTVYICSGTDRILCRELTDGVLPITENHVIGMDVMLKARGQGDTDGLDYTYKKDDEVVRTDELLIKNVKMNKVSMLARELGQQPVLSFGNSSGDTSMAVYVTSNNPYRSEAFMLVADDNVRDYGNPEKAEELREKWEDYGWNVISMKDDFATIYGENVTRTSK